MFWQDLDPGYYQNPAAYTYLVYGVLRVLYGPLGFLFGLPYGNVTEQFDKDPAELWVVARTLAAVLCMAGVAATYAAARRLWGVREGLVAAAVLAFAFLPVAYSRVAVTDVGALAGRGAGADVVGAGRRATGGPATTCWPARQPGWRSRSSTRPGWCCCRSAIAALARLRADGARPLAGLALGGLAARGRVRAAQPVPVRLARGLVDATCATRPTSPPASPSRARSRAASPTTSTASPGASAGPAIAAALAGAVLVLRRDLVRGLMLVGAAGGAVRLPGAAVALLRALAAARLPGAGDAGGGGGRARR